MKLSDLGEFGFIERIAAKARTSSWVRVGIGDDAAVTLPTPGMAQLSTSDMLVEGIHFNLDWSDPHSLGRKSLAVNLSDIAAMGGIPRYALLSLAIPPSIPVQFLDDFIAGFLEQAEQCAVVLAGGDTCAATGELVISVTLIGEQYPDRIVTRSGALPGDLICVTGTVGDSAVGLELLRRGEPLYGPFGRHLNPAPRVCLGKSLADAAILTAMIDISDGLLADLGHILKQSGRGGRIEAGQLPLSDEYRKISGHYGADPCALALSGGEDYELLFTLNPEQFDTAARLGREAGIPVTKIGVITAEPGLFVVTEDGKCYKSGRSGFDHFGR